MGTKSEFIGNSTKARRSLLKHLSHAVTKAQALMPVAVHFCILIGELSALEVHILARHITPFLW